MRMNCEEVLCDGIVVVGECEVGDGDCGDVYELCECRVVVVLFELERRDVGGDVVR